MRFYGVVLGMTVLAVGAGCAKNDLDSLHLVSTKEVSVQKRQQEASGEEVEKAVSEEAVTAAAPAPEETAKDL